MTQAQARLWQVQAGVVVVPQAGTGLALHDTSGGRVQLAPAMTSDAGGQGPPVHDGKLVTQAHAKLWQLQTGVVVVPQADTGLALHDT